MKINCYQVAPEHQESPLTFDFPEDISVFGNRNFIDSFSDEIEPIMKVLRDSTFTWALNCCESTDERREQLKDWFPEMPDWDDTEIENLTSFILNEVHYNRIFSYITGIYYERMLISGTCQSDWNYAYYPEGKWTENELINFEIEYWNQGAEWECETEDGSDFIYTHSCDSEKQRVEIAEELGVDPKDIVLHKFVGWKRTAEYEQC